MGVCNSYPIAPLDEELENIVRRSKIPVECMNKLYLIFTTHDVSGSGNLSRELLFTTVIPGRRSLLTDALCTLVGIKPTCETVTFSEFAQMFCIFCLFGPFDCIQYRDKIGYVDKEEFRHFLVDLIDPEGNLTANILHAVRFLESQGRSDGMIPYEDVLTVYQNFPSLFAPIFALQVNMQIVSFGERFWELKSFELAEIREEKKRIANRPKKMRLQEKQSLVSEDQLRKKMGISYYIMFWTRDDTKAIMEKLAELDQAAQAEEKAAQESMRQLMLG